jgi:hypothetical protein
MDFCGHQLIKLRLPCFHFTWNGLHVAKVYTNNIHVVHEVNK